MKFTHALAAGSIVLSGSLLAGGAAHAVAGCTTVTSPSVTLCSFVADAATGGVHADTIWALTDNTSGILIAFGGAYDPVTTPGAFFETVALVPGHMYTLQLNAPGAGIAESGL